MSVPKIIGLAGRARSGKDTCAGFLTNRGFLRRGFADPLKEAARAIFGFSDAQLFGDEKEVEDPFWEKSPRRILQLLGTEAVRQQIDDQAWVKSLMRFVSTSPRPVVVPDVRFPNEAEAIRAAGGTVWRVDRPGIAGVSAHVSETALDGYSFDRVLRNDGSLADLERGVLGVLSSMLNE